MASRLWFPLTALALVAACGGGSDSTPQQAGTTTAPPKKPTVIDIAVDANRDGKVDPADMGDQGFEDRKSWDEKHGASFLANLDDDDGDHARDVEDIVINGATDQDDIAPIVVSPWPDAPDGAVGTFTIDEAAKQLVRIWKKGLDGNWSLVAGAMGACTTPIDGADATGTANCMTFATSATLTTDEVRKGVELGIEGRRFRVSDTDPWDGFVNLGYTVADAKGAKFTADDGTSEDTAVMRIAPWVLFGNLSPFDTVWSSSGSGPFVKDLTTAIKKDPSITYNKISFAAYDDQWTQDYFQTAWTGIPGPNGTVRGMRVANPRPWSQPGAKLPITWLMKTFLSPDRAVFQIYKKDQSGSSFDSHGNHDLLPPYTNGADAYPLGRIVHGSNVLPETHAFYVGQAVQGPPVELVTDWLWVGHVDEFLSYVPAKTPRGWKLLVASPSLAKTMFQAQVAAGNGAVPMFVGKQRYDAMNGNPIDAQITIDQMLADTEVMKASDESQAFIDTNVATLKQALGLTDSEIIYIPTLFETDCDQGSCGHIADMPGTVNSLVFGDHIVMPNPFGPTISGADIFAKDIQDRLGTPVNALGKNGMGLDVNFANDWDTYHILAGEVHCGSNVDAPAPFASAKWWEAGK